MADSLSNIYNSLNGGGYDAQRSTINQQLGAVDGQTQGVVAGLNAQKTNAFQGIDNQAASRGMFYSGAPIAEEQKYTGGTYLPALANVQTQAQNQKFGLQQALAGVGTAQTGAAQGIYQNQVQSDQQNNYYNQQLAQQRAYNDSMTARGGGSGGGQAPTGPPAWQQNFNTGLGNAFKGYGTVMANGNTEKNIIPQMVQQYGAYAAPQDIAKQVYAYRKAVYNQ